MCHLAQMMSLQRCDPSLPYPNPHRSHPRTVAWRSLGSPPVFRPLIGFSQSGKNQQCVTRAFTAMAAVCAERRAEPGVCVRQLVR